MSYFLHDMVQSQTIEAEYYLRKRSRQHKPHEIKIRRTGKSWTGVTTEVCMAMVDWCKDAFGQPGSELAFKWAWHSRTGYTSFFFANKAHASMFKFNFHGKDFDEILPENIEDEA